MNDVLTAVLYTSPVWLLALALLPITYMALRKDKKKKG